MTFKKASFVLVLLVSAVQLSPAEAPGQEPQQVILFNSGEEGYPRYRVPAVIVAPNNDVLAFCEGRVAGGGFTGNVDIVMKRSTDGGKTWGPLQTIADDGPNTFGYPVPVVERQSKTVWLIFTRSRGE